MVQRKITDFTTPCFITWVRTLKKDKVLESFKKDFKAVKEKGWVQSHRHHDTGIGKTFEDLVGVVENNNHLADYKDLLELKSSRELSESMVTLFTKAPTHPKDANTYIRENYGSKDSSGLKILHTTIDAIKFNTYKGKYGFKLEVNEENTRIIILVKDLKTGKIIDNSVYYNLEVLKEIIDKKCKYVIFITAESKKVGGKEFFNFKEAMLLSGLTLEKFIKSIKEGIIRYDIRIGVYKSGEQKGKTHDHGSGFRILKNRINDVFKVEEI